MSVAVSSQSDKLFGLFLCDSPRKELDEDFANARDCVPIIGFGRVGQIAVEALLFEKIPVMRLDHDVDRVREAELFGRTKAELMQL